MAHYQLITMAGSSALMSVENCRLTCRLGSISGHYEDIVDFEPNSPENNA
jgi:hypothetical protein